MTSRYKRVGCCRMLSVIIQLFWILPHHVVSSSALPPSLLRNLARGAALRVMADLSGGLPLEVWKSAVVLERLRGQETNQQQTKTSIQILQTLLKERGVQGMWSGCSARVAEGFLTGAILLAAKEALRRSLLASPVIRKTVPPALIGFIAGAGGGAAQALVMAPTTFLVTATAAKDGQSVLGAAKAAWSQEGLRGIYRGSAAVAARQATNWASRQGFTELIRPRITIKGVPGELIAGCLGGTLSCWNTPFEVSRIYAQSRIYSSTSDNTTAAPLWATMNQIVKTHGMGFLYTGVGPRICQACFQTVFLVCIPRLLTW